VATPTGLITPIVRDVGGKGLSSISAETKTLAKKARDGKLQPHEYQVNIIGDLFKLIYAANGIRLYRVVRSPSLIWV